MVGKSGWARISCETGESRCWERWCILFRRPVHRLGHIHRGEFSIMERGGGDDEDGTDIWGVWGCPGRDPTLPSHQRLIKVRAGQTATDGD